MKHFPHVFGAGLYAILIPTFALHAEMPPAPATGTTAAPILREDPDGGEYWPDVMAVLEIYAIGKDDAREVLETKQSSAGRYRYVLNLERHGKARLKTLTALATKQGQKAVVEACDEVRYPAAFTSGKPRGDLSAPTASETRDVGDTFEFESNISPDGVSCSLNLIPQCVSLAGFRDVSGKSDDPHVAQPLFSVQKLSTSTKVAIDRADLIGTFSPAPGNAPVNRKAAPEIWMAFLHVHRVFAAAERRGLKSRFWGAAINMEYSFYSLDRDAARDLLRSFPKLATPWERLQGLLRKNKARFEDIISVKTSSGQRSVAEATNETRFGTQDALPGEPRTRATTTRAGAPPESENDKKKLGQNSSPAIRETETVGSENPTPEAVSGGPTASGTRETGLSVEVESAINPDGATVDVNMIVKSASDLGRLKATGAGAYIPAQPVFERRDFTTSISTLFGSHFLVGTLSAPGADGVNGRADDRRTWLVFLRLMPAEP